MGYTVERDKLLDRIDTITQIYTSHIVVAFPLTHKSNFAKLICQRNQGLITFSILIASTGP